MPWKPKSHAQRLREANPVKDTRVSAARRGYDSKWRTAREGFLRKHQLCAACKAQGLIVAATVVDHIVPHKGDMKAFWIRSNWQPLCKTCHDSKTAREDGGFGR